MDNLSVTRPVRRMQTGIETEDFTAGREYHTLPLQQNCEQCNSGSRENEPNLLVKMKESYTNITDVHPFDVYRHFHPLYQFNHSTYETRFTPVALPGKRLRNELRTGDIVLKRMPISDKTLEAIIMDPGLLSYEKTGGDAAGFRKSGRYVRTYGNRAGSGKENAYLRITNNNHRIPGNVLVLRINKDMVGQGAAGMAEEVTIDPTDERIDVRAKFSLQRMLKQGGQAALDAEGMVNAINTGQLTGIDGDNTYRAVQTARQLGTQRWLLVPQGKDAHVVQVPAGASSIVFRDGIEKSSTRIDTALRAAWTSFAPIVPGVKVPGTIPGIDPGGDGPGGQVPDLPHKYVSPPEFGPPGIIPAQHPAPVTFMSTFRAATNGFQFRNDFVNHFLPSWMPLSNKIKTEGLCGGMSYAALDYYYAGIRIPPQRTTDFPSSSGIPPEGSRFYNYLYQRQMDSFTIETLAKFVKYVQLSYERVQQDTRNELPAIRSSIQAGKPLVIGLIDTSGNYTDSHQIVVYGYRYDPGWKSTILFVYDSNHPDQECQLMVTDALAGVHESVGGTPGSKTWKGFFTMPYQSAYPSFMSDPDEVWSEDWTTGWSSLMPFTIGGQPHYLAYKTSSGGVNIDRVRPGGKGIESVWADKWFEGWSSFMPFELGGQPHYLAYMIKTGQVNISRIRPDGRGVDSLWTDKWSTGWSSFIPFVLGGQQHYLAYKINTGAVNIDRIRPDGKGIEPVWADKWPTGWSSFMPFIFNGQQHFLLYNINTGAVKIDRIRPDGKGTEPVWADKWSTGWSTFLPFVRGQLYYLAYKIKTGEVTVDYIRPDGQGVGTIWSKPAGGWSKGWSSFINVQLNGAPHYLACKVDTGQMSISQYPRPPVMI